ncbi:MAG TPA: hypothetical protein VFG87_27375 [Amycolatopsis sp.]|nr:hypothetical protein [Amycolatopsis sp.]
MAGSPAGVLAQRLGIRTGRVVAPAGLLVVFAGTALFLLPPHSAIAAIGLGIGGVCAFALGVLRFAGGPWWALIIAVASGALLFAALNVAGRGLALHLFGQDESCLVVHREEVETTARYPHEGFVHTVRCPAAGTLTIRTDSTDRQEPGARVDVLDDPGGLLEPDFAHRHDLAVDVLVLVAALGSVVATVLFVRSRAGSGSTGKNVEKVFRPAS